jgi:hypothetical protein
VADEQLSIDVTAKDSASKVIGGIQKNVDKLDKSDPEVDITADAKKADHTVDGLKRQLDGLADDDKVIVLALRAGAATAELRDLAGDLARIDASDPDVDVKFARYAEVSGQLDALEQQMKDLGSTGAVDVGHVNERLDGMAASAGNAQGAVHSMAGNAVGDFAATATGIGPLGEALGQLTEGIAAGETSMRGLAVAGLGLGAVSAAMLALNAVMGHFADASERAAKIKAFNDQAIKDYTASIIAARIELDRLNGIEPVEPVDPTANDHMKALAANTAELVDQWEKAGKIEAFNPVTGQVEDMTAAMARSDITAEMWADAIMNGGVAINKLGTQARDAGVSEEKRLEIMQTAAAEMVKYDQAQTAAAEHNKVFARSVDTATDAQRAHTAEAARYQGQADEYARKVDRVAKKMSDLAEATDDETNAYKALSDQISGDQAMLDLADQLDDVRTAGDDAYAAQAAANQAIKTNAKDATEKQREAEQAMRDYQSAVNATKQDIINLGATANATPLEISTALAKVDQGDLAGAKADAEAWSKRNPVQLSAELRVQLIRALGAGLGTVQVAAGGTSTTTVNNFGAGPGAVPSLSAAAAPARWARINGR